MVVPFMSAILLERNVSHLSAADMRFRGVAVFDPKQACRHFRHATLSDGDETFVRWPSLRAVMAGSPLVSRKMLRCDKINAALQHLSASVTARCQFFKRPNGIAVPRALSY